MSWNFMSVDIDSKTIVRNDQNNSEGKLTDDPSNESSIVFDESDCCYVQTESD